METLLRTNRQSRTSVIKLIEHAAIDKARWDHCVLSCSTPLVYAESWYLDIVSPGWIGLIEGDYHSVMPLPHRRKWGMDYIFQPPFVQQLGVFGKKNADEFIEAIPLNFQLADLVLNSGNQTERFKAVPRPNLILSLSSDYESLHRTFSENTRRNIKRSIKAGLRIEEVADLESVISLFQSTKGRRVSLGESDYSILRRIEQAARAQSRWEGYSVFDTKGVLLAGACFLKSPHGWIFLFSATHPAGRETGAMSALIDGFIRKHAGQNTLLDFEGSLDPSLYRFYRSFGAEESVYLSLRLNRMPWLWRWLKP